MCKLREVKARLKEWNKNEFGNINTNLQEKMRKFLWGDSEERRKLHLVGWDRVTKSKKKGGLGVKRIQIHNAKLLCKSW